MTKKSCEARLDGLCVKGFSFRSKNVVTLILTRFVPHLPWPSIGKSWSYLQSTKMRFRKKNLARPNPSYFWGMIRKCSWKDTCGILQMESGFEGCAGKRNKL